MISINTRLKNIDNSGAIMVRCIRILGKPSRALAKVGDLIIVSVKTYRPGRKVKRGEVYRALVVRTKSRLKRSGGIYVSAGSAAVILLNKQGNPLGTRILGPVFKELKYTPFSKVLAMAAAVV